MMGRRMLFWPQMLEPYNIFAHPILQKFIVPNYLKRTLQKKNEKRKKNN